MKDRATCPSGAARRTGFQRRALAQAGHPPSCQRARHVHVSFMCVAQYPEFASWPIRAQEVWHEELSRVLLVLEMSPQTGAQGLPKGLTVVLPCVTGRDA